MQRLLLKRAAQGSGLTPGESRPLVGEWTLSFCRERLAGMVHVLALGEKRRLVQKSAACAVAPSVGLGALCVEHEVVRAQAADDAVRAQEADDETCSAARALANQAADAYDAGDYQKAADLFSRAYALMPVPSLSILEARAFEQLGLLVQACEAYQRTARVQVHDHSPLPFRRAVQEATDAILQLEARLPRLTIVTSSTDKEDPGLQVKIDGEPVERLLTGVEHPVNPGTSTSCRQPPPRARTRLLR